MIRRQAATERVADAVELDLGDLHRVGEGMLRRSEAQAEQIVADARAERDRLIAGAEERGYADGHQRGVAEGLEEGRARGRAEAAEEHAQRLAEIETSWAEALAAFIGQREQMLFEARAGVIELAALMAAKVTRRAVELDSSATAVAALDDLLAMIVRPSRLQVSVAAVDHNVVQSALPRLTSALATDTTHISLQKDDALGAGSVRVRTADGGELDASVETQLQRLLSALLPAPQAAAALTASKRPIEPEQQQTLDPPVDTARAGPEAQREAQPQAVVEASKDGEDESGAVPRPDAEAPDAGDERLPGTGKTPPAPAGDRPIDEAREQAREPEREPGAEDAP